MNNVVVLSGGMDSATVLGYVKECSAGEILCVFFDYKQRTVRKEKQCAKKLCEFYGAEFTEVKTRFDSSGLVDKGDNYEVVARNPIMCLHALNIGYNNFNNYNFNIWMGIQGTDSTDYIDCTKNSVYNMQIMVNYLSGEKTKVMLPFLKMNKKSILVYGIKKDVPYHLTWSCYVDNKTPCGKCPSCKLRQKAFKSLKYEDPICFKKK